MQLETETLYQASKLRYGATRLSITVKFLLVFPLKREEGERKRDVKGEKKILVLESSAHIFVLNIFYVLMIWQVQW